MNDKLLPITKLARSHGLEARHLAGAAKRGQLAVVQVGARLFSTPQAVADLLKPKLLNT
jgi:hypothetical protein